MEQKIQNQKEVMEQRIKEENLIPEEFEYLYLPGLDSFFEYPSIQNLPTQEKKIKVEQIIDKKIPRNKLAELITEYILFNSRVAGIKWDFYSKELILLQSNISLLNLDDKSFKEDLKDLVTLILKSRNFISGIDWRFGKDHVIIKTV